MSFLEVSQDFIQPDFIQPGFIQPGFIQPGFIQNIGLPGLVIILIIALIVFGKRLPDVARSLGKGIVEFKKGVRGIEDEVEKSMHEAETREEPPARRDSADAGGGSTS